MVLGGGPPGVVLAVAAESHHPALFPLQEFLVLLYLQTAVFLCAGEQEQLPQMTVTLQPGDAD